MVVCTVCGTVWAAKLNACPGHGCGGALRPVGPAEADHPVLRRFPMARIRGTTARVAPAAVAVTVATDPGGDAGAGPPQAAPAPTTSPKAKVRKPATGAR